ncbi:MAG: hypothetical protein FWD03_02235 [Defluviitaleaceae bacterium]|nr:hypothetical protein [Defluviitaleaceae bacterium]
MVDKNKIMVMTKMAVHDKRHGDADRRVFAFFRRDYIYRKNMWTRLSVSIGAVFLLAIYWLHQIFIYGVDVQEIHIEQSVINSVLFLLAVMAFYTVIGTIQGTHQYYQVQKRMRRYMAMLKSLEQMPDSPEAAEDDDGTLVYADQE